MKYTRRPPDLDELMRIRSFLDNNKIFFRMEVIAAALDTEVETINIFINTGQFPEELAWTLVDLIKRLTTIR